MKEVLDQITATGELLEHRLQSHGYEDRDYAHHSNCSLFGTSRTINKTIAPTVAGIKTKLSGVGTCIRTTKSTTVEASAIVQNDSGRAAVSNVTYYGSN